MSRNLHNVLDLNVVLDDAINNRGHFVAIAVACHEKIKFAQLGMIELVGGSVRKVLGRPE